MRYRVRSSPIAIAAGMLLGSAAMLAPLAASAVTIDWVTVGAPGNAADSASNHQCGFPEGPTCGAVPYTYRISKYETTNAQYAEFLNAVADTDPNALYTFWMGGDAINGGITRSGSSGSYSYSVKPGFENKPVGYITFWNALRFANWLNNGHPSGAQGTLTTEDGAYTLTAATIAANSVLRNPNASVFLPSENEWYKAAYYDPITGVYYDFPTGTNVQTSCVAPDSDTGNSANCDRIVGEFTNVGSYAHSSSPSGTYDQGGNATEWNEIIAFDGRGRRGGSWYDFNLEANQGGHAITIGGAAVWLGFRVASIPEPPMGVGDHEKT